MAQDLQSACKISRADIEALRLDSITTHEVDLLRGYLQVLLLQQVKEELVEGTSEEVVARVDSFDDLWNLRPDFHADVVQKRTELLNDVRSNPAGFLKAASLTRPPLSTTRKKAAPLSSTKSIDMRDQDNQMPDEIAAIKPNTVIRDHYRIIEPTGAGGMSTVYLAEDMHLKDKKVAMKIMAKDLVQNPAMLKHFSAQVEALVKLDGNPHVINIKDSDNYCGIPFIVMEYVVGFNLKELLVRYRTLSNTVAANYAKQVAEGLTFVHNNNILHLDVKPANILIKGSTDTALLSDFDISWNPDWGVSIGGAGTPAYMAPEQFASHDIRDYGPETDIFALGATLYNMVTGQPPYDGRNSSNYLNMGYQKPHELNPAVDAQLESIILHCMQWDKADRYHSASDLAKDLASYLDSVYHVRTLTSNAPQEIKITRGPAEKVKQREGEKESNEWVDKTQDNEEKPQLQRKHRNHRPILAIIALSSAVLIVLLLWSYVISISTQGNDSSSQNETKEVSNINKNTIEGENFAKLGDTYYYCHENLILKANEADPENPTIVYGSTYGNINSIVSIDNGIYYLCKDYQNNTLSLCQMTQSDGLIYESILKSVQVDDLSNQSLLHLHWYNGSFYIVYYQTYKDKIDNSARKIHVIIVNAQDSKDEPALIKTVTPVYFSKNHCVFFSAGTIFYSDDLGNIRYHPIDDISKAGIIREEDYRARDDASKRSQWFGNKNLIASVINDGTDSITLLVNSPIKWGLSLMTGNADSEDRHWVNHPIIGSDYNSHYLSKYYLGITVYDIKMQRVYFTVEFSKNKNSDPTEGAVLSCKLDGSDLQQCVSSSLSTNSSEEPSVEPVLAQNGRVLICLRNSGDDCNIKYIEMNTDGTDHKVIFQGKSQ